MEDGTRKRVARRWTCWRPVRRANQSPRRAAAGVERLSSTRLCPGPALSDGILAPAPRVSVCAELAIHFGPPNGSECTEIPALVPAATARTLGGHAKAANRARIREPGQTVHAPHAVHATAAVIHTEWQVVHDRVTRGHRTGRRRSPSPGPSMLAGGAKWIPSCAESSIQDASLLCTCGPKQPPTWLAPIACLDPVDSSTRSSPWPRSSASALSPQRQSQPHCRSSRGAVAALVWPLQA